MIHYTAANWPVSSRIKTASTFRHGGVSQGPFFSLNMGDHVGDDLSSVSENRRRLQQQLCLPVTPCWLNQVHGPKVVQARPGTCADAADASFTADENTVCAVLTADCLPMLIADKNGSTVAAVHGGWRGLLAGVVENTVEAMDSNELVAWLGPAIGPKVFEIGDEVREGFLSKNRSFAVAFKPGGRGRWFADIYWIARIVLNSNGVDKVYGGQFCTYSDSSRFFSFRRDGQTGRMATLIWRE